MIRKIALGLTIFLLAVPRMGSVDVRLSKEGAELCFTCHGDRKAEFTENEHVHIPVVIGNCTSCHSPHAGRYRYMLREEIEELCYTCHADAKEEAAPYVHTPVMQGKCTGCHDPHASEFDHQLKEAPDRICFGCHAGIRDSIEKLQDVHPPVAAGECGECHNSHSSAYVANLNQPPETLCFACHNREERRFGKAHLGYPVGQGGCTICHNPHATDNTKLIQTYSHFPMQALMCDSCHVGPGTSDPFQLVKFSGDLCNDCHGSTIDDFNSKPVTHVPVKEKECIVCHSPHASKYKNQLIEPEGKLCLSCHVDTAEVIRGEGMFVHTALKEIGCTKCHNPHSSNTDRLLTSSDTAALCLGCHGQMREHSHPIGPDYIDPRTNRMMTCTSCHASHASKYKYILHYDRKRELCVQCHEL